MAAQYAVKETAGEGAVSWDGGVRCVLPEVQIGGKVEQQRYCGKNLVGPDVELFNATWFWDKSAILDESFDRIAYRENTQYTVSWDATLPEGSGAIYYIRFIYTNGSESGYGGFHVVSPDQDRKDGVYAITSEAGKTVAQIVAQGGDYGDFTLHWIQVEEGAEATAYEPYTGGVPVPNPDWPVMPVVSEGTTVVSNGGGTAVAPELLAIPGTDIRDEWNPQTGKGVRRCAAIESYAGESITTPYLSSTGELSEGAYVIYGIAETPFQTDPQPLTAPHGSGQIVQTGGNLDGVPITVKYVTHS